ncbi:uncharacterized protein LOC129731029 [Wyeomyia smithii]|uniref:uncharacterized protein LOC129731029 n=1 Tax=Wyeomyia smithii TaxID=174621 RepID=UPI002467EAF8|nr:uncharacterized protein LOC129731029 [Wyeomyia smithii]
MERYSVEKDISIVKSVKGGEMLSLNGYLYHLNRKQELTFYWECNKRRHVAGRAGCTARATTVFSDGAHKLLLSSEHTHAPDPVERETKIFRDNLKRKSEESSGSVAKIIQVTLNSHSSEIQSRMTEGARRKTVERIRSKAVSIVEPQTLEGFSITDTYKILEDGEKFLIGDVEDDGQRALIFGTRESVLRLSQAKYWIIDGTFSTVPGLFRQLLSIHASIGPSHERSFPVIFALLTSKHELLYKKVFFRNTRIQRRKECEA